MIAGIFGAIVVIFVVAMVVGYLLIFISGGVARRLELLRRVIEDLDEDLVALIDSIDSSISNTENHESNDRLVTSGKGSISLGAYSRERNTFAVINPGTGELIGIVDSDAFVVTEVLDPETEDIYITDDESFSKILVTQARKRGAIEALSQLRSQISKLQHSWHWVRVESRYSHHLSVF